MNQDFLVGDVAHDQLLLLKIGVMKEIEASLMM